MPYDSNLDVEIFSKTHEKEGQKIIVSIHAYNNGPKKLQIIRQNLDAQGALRFGKLGRLTKEEVEAILPFIQEALTQM